MMVAVLESSVPSVSFRAALVVAVVLMTLGDCGGGSGGGAVDRRWKSKKGQYTIEMNYPSSALSVVKTQDDS